LLHHAQLRYERSYRAYVLGLRLFLLAAAVIGLSVAAWRGGFMSDELFKIAIPLAMLVGIPGVVMGGVGWLVVPDKNKISANPDSFRRMLISDIIKGIPRQG
jgi:hypothetical protein